MLSSLHIRNYILIDSLDVTFPEGLVIITGQTGAGKSILLGALSLLAGAKADASEISAGAQSCVVEAEFDGVDPALADIVEENGAEWDGGHLVVRRVVNENGRSRCFVNDCPVNAAALTQIAQRLIDIHSQHKSLLLTDKAFQLSILDNYAGNSELLSECSAEWKKLRSLESELTQTRARLESLSADGDYNEAQFRQLDQARLRPGELEELEAEQKSLANAEQIKEALGRVRELFDASEYPGVGAALRESTRKLSAAGRFVPSALALEERLESARLEIEDIYAEVCALDNGIDLSPEHLQSVEDRLSLLYTLLKKYSCTTVEELVGVRDSFGAGAVDLEDLKEKIAQLESDVENSRNAWQAFSRRLHESRQKASVGFCGAVTEYLRFLELDRAVFGLDLVPGNPGPLGAESVCFKFSADGLELADVAKCASGGEISRIMLSLKAMMARFAGMPTLVFDEIDTGVSGSVADRMGRMICEMGETMQVFSITHLPQVAAKGKAHYVVTKQFSEGRTVSSIHRVDGEERVAEIARLLSGETVTEAAVANARALIENR